jgi:hypothetical protein
MKAQHFFCYLALLAVSFTACKKSDDGQSSPQIKKEIFSGYAQKGPFTNGSSVTILELKENLDQTGKTYFTTISDNLGNFEQKNIELISRYIALKADGFYFNEVSGQISDAPMTLYALVDIEDVNSANVNVLTHLEKSRVEYLVQQERIDFSVAKQQAQREVLAIFGFEPSEMESETLDLTIDAKLLAISCLLQGRLSTGEMMELMANINADIKEDGTLDNMALGAKLMDNANAIKFSLSEIRNNLTDKYTESGNNVSIPDFESCIQSFINSKLYSPSSISYPEIGMMGRVNILSDHVTEINTQTGYNMFATVPKGQDLKIVLKDGYWIYLAGFWDPSNYDETNRVQEFTIWKDSTYGDGDIGFYDGIFDENGKEYITIEYYENRVTTPTKTKRLYINKP